MDVGINDKVTRDLLCHVVEFLQFLDFPKTLEVLLTERTDRRKQVSASINIRPNTKAYRERMKADMLRKFDEGRRDEFLALWQQYVPASALGYDLSTQKVEFHLQTYFAIFPVLPCSAVLVVVPGNGNHRPHSARAELAVRMQVFKEYLEVKGRNLVHSPELTPLAALPYISQPEQHPFFGPLFTSAWVEDQRQQLKQFLDKLGGVRKLPKLYDMYSALLEATDGVPRTSPTTRAARAAMRKQNRSPMPEHERLRPKYNALWGDGAHDKSGHSPRHEDAKGIPPEAPSNMSPRPSTPPVFHPPPPTTSPTHFGKSASAPESPIPYSSVQSYGRRHTQPSLDEGMTEGFTTMEDLDMDSSVLMMSISKSAMEIEWAREVQEPSGTTAPPVLESLQIPHSPLGGTLSSAQGNGINSPALQTPGQPPVSVSQSRVSLPLSQLGGPGGLIRRTMSNLQSGASIAAFIPLDYDKVKSDIWNGPTSLSTRVLQALRWRLTGTNVPSERQQLLALWAQADILGLVSNGSSDQSQPFLESIRSKDDLVLAEEAVRLVGSMACYQLGRSYLCQPGASVVPALFALAISEPSANPGASVSTSSVRMQTAKRGPPLLCYAVSALIKLSSRVSAIRSLNDVGAMRWLVSFLSDSAGRAPLSMQLCVLLLERMLGRHCGREAAEQLAAPLVEMCKALIEFSDGQVQPIALSCLAAALMRPGIREQARSAGLHEFLTLMSEQEPSLRGQLAHIQKLLASDNGMDMEAVIEEEDADYGDDGDLSDLPTMYEYLDCEDQLPKGEQLLCGNYLAQNAPVVTVPKLLPAASSSALRSRRFVNVKFGSTQLESERQAATYGAEGEADKEKSATPGALSAHNGPVYSRSRSLDRSTMAETGLRQQPFEPAANPSSAAAIVYIEDQTMDADGLPAESQIGISQAHSVVPPRPLGDSMGASAFPVEGEHESASQDRSVAVTSIPNYSLEVAAFPQGSVKESSSQQRSLAVASLPAQSMEAAAYVEDSVEGLPLPDKSMASAAFPEGSIEVGAFPDQSTAAASLPSRSVEAADLPDQSVARASLANGSIEIADLPDNSTAMTTLPNQSAVDLPDRSIAAASSPDRGAARASAPTKSLEVPIGVSSASGIPGVAPDKSLEVPVGVSSASGIIRTSNMSNGYVGPEAVSGSANVTAGADGLPMQRHSSAGSVRPIRTIAASTSYASDFILPSRAASFVAPTASQQIESRAAGGVQETLQSMRSRSWERFGGRASENVRHSRSIEVPVNGGPSAQQDPNAHNSPRSAPAPQTSSSGGAQDPTHVSRLWNESTTSLRPPASPASVNGSLAALSAAAPANRTRLSNSGIVEPAASLPKSSSDIGPQSLALLSQRASRLSGSGVPEAQSPSTTYRVNHSLSVSARRSSREDREGEEFAYQAGNEEGSRTSASRLSHKIPSGMDRKGLSVKP